MKACRPGSQLLSSRISGSFATHVRFVRGIQLEFPKNYRANEYEAVEGIDGTDLAIISGL